MNDSINRILRLKDVCTQTGLCRSAIYDLEAHSEFPKRIQLTARAVGWIDKEVRDWIEERIELSRRPRTAACELEKCSLRPGPLA